MEKDAIWRCDPIFILVHRSYRRADVHRIGHHAAVDHDEPGQRRNLGGRRCTAASKAPGRGGPNASPTGSSTANIGIVVTAILKLAELCKQALALLLRGV